MIYLFFIIACLILFDTYAVRRQMAEMIRQNEQLIQLLQQREGKLSEDSITENN